VAVTLQAPQPVLRTARLWYLDNLKVALTILVILHHVGQAYGPTGGFWFYEEAQRWPPLGTFFYINASFFMGLFFFISAYFLPGSVDRKGVGSFLRDRAIRLGIPLVFFVLLVIPVLQYVSYLHFRGGAGSYLDYFAQVYLGGGPKPANWRGPSWPELNFGHLWFIEHLLVYALLYAGIRLVWRKPAVGPAAEAAPSDWAILAFTLVLTAVTLLVRGPYPIDRWIGFLGFIQMEPAHLPQYLSFFILGAVAYRKGWLASLPKERGMRWLYAGLLAVGVVVLCSAWLDAALPEQAVSLIRTTAECFIAVGLSLGLITLFRERAGGSSPLWRALSDAAFGAYLFHVPVLVAIQYAAEPLPAGPAIKFLLVGVASVVATFAFSHLLRKIPGAKRIL
jgi:glucan biosynthesis protein C